MTKFCYLILNCISSNGVFKFIVRVSGLLVPCHLILLYFIHIGADHDMTMALILYYALIFYEWYK